MGDLNLLHDQMIELNTHIHEKINTLEVKKVLFENKIKEFDDLKLANFNSYYNIVTEAKKVKFDQIAHIILSFIAVFINVFLRFILNDFVTVSYFSSAFICGVLTLILYSKKIFIDPVKVKKRLTNCKEKLLKIDLEEIEELTKLKDEILELNSELNRENAKLETLNKRFHQELSNEMNKRLAENDIDEKVKIESASMLLPAKNKVLLVYKKDSGKIDEQ